MVDLIGQQVGNYKIVRLLGAGGFAEVYLGEHIYLKSQAAIKVVSMQFGESETANFLAEARTLVNLKHPHIVQILDFGMQGKTPFLVMEYAPRGTLSQLHPKGSRLSVATIIKYTQQVASALQYAHDRRLIHRDIKPENMLLQENSNLLLADFGIALIAQSTYQSHKGMVGTAAYMAPEQIRGKPGLASDQYSLGIVIYEWLSGSKPFEGTFTEMCAQHIYAAPPPLREKLPALPAEIDYVVQTALAKEPAQRYSSVQEFANALELAHQSSAQNANVLPSPAIHLPPATYHTPAQNHPYATIQDRQEDRIVLFETPRQQKHTFYTPNNEQTYPSSPPPSSPPPMVQPRKSRSGIIALCMASILIVLISGGGILYATMFNHLNQSAAKPQSQATSVAQTKATVAVQPTATPSPNTPPSPQDLYTRATSGAPVLNDSLAVSDTNNWDNVGNSCSYTGGNYHARITQTSHYIQCLAQSSTFRNFAFQIDMTIVSGTRDDGGGIIFRSTNDENDRLHVAIDGKYDLVNQKSNLINGSSPAIKTGLYQTNRLTVITQEQQIYLYINQQYIGKVDGGTAVAGRIGVMAVCWTQPTEAAYSNAKVWQL